MHWFTYSLQPANGAIVIVATDVENLSRETEQSCKRDIVMR